MNKEIVDLVIYLDCYGLENFNNPYPLSFLKTELSRIDKVTFECPNAQRFFEKNKYVLLLRCKSKFNAEKKVPPVDVALNKKGVLLFSEKYSKSYPPLFETMTISEKVYPTIDVVAKRLYKKRIYDLYHADKENQKNPDYQSIFTGFDGEFVECLEQKTDVTPQAMYLFLNAMKSKDFYFQILRFALSEGANFDIVNNKQKERERIKKENIYRPPYKDD